MSRFTRKKRGRRGKPSASPPLQSSESVAAAAAAYDGDGLCFPPGEQGMRAIDREHLENYYQEASAWRYKPGAIHLGGGHRAKPTFLANFPDGSVCLDFVTKSLSDELAQLATMLQDAHPWFAVRVFSGGEQVDLATRNTFRVEHPPPVRETGDPRESMSPFEREHAERLDDWVARGLVHGWIYEPATWSIGFRCSYSPDFLVYGPDGVEWHEVKAHNFKEDGLIKLKMFASLYPFFNVRMVQRYRKKGDSHDSWRSMPIKAGDPFGFR